MYSSYANEFQELEIVAPTALDSPVVIVPIHSRRIDRDLWICISMDRVCFVLRSCCSTDSFADGV